MQAQVVSVKMQLHSKMQLSDSLCLKFTFKQL